MKHLTAHPFQAFDSWHTFTHSKLLQAKLGTVFSEDDLHTLWSLLHAHCEASEEPEGEAAEVIDYPSFCEVRARAFFPQTLHGHMPPPHSYHQLVLPSS